MSPRWWTSRLTQALLLGAVGCSGASSLDDHPCPSSKTRLTYENFGEGFFSRYCTTCHGGPNGYSSRSFSSLQLICANQGRIFINAAADNASMPPGPGGPARSERDDLADWLACGAP